MKKEAQLKHQELLQKLDQENEADERRLNEIKKRLKKSK